MSAPDSEQDGAPRERFLVDLRVYSPSAVAATCYRLERLFTAKIELRDQDTAEVRVISWADGVDRNAAEPLFFRELHDQALREIISRETEGVRDLILAHALSRIPILDAELDKQDYRDDPQLKDDGAS
jgi:His-Xaa-Ser system protein HxsD